MLVGRRALASAAAGLSAALSSRRVRRWLVRVAVLAVALPLALQWLLAYVVAGDARLLPRRLQGARSLLVVTAHPDDECLFFAPSVLGVLDRGRRRDGDGGNGGGGMKGGLLVMSTGNNYGLGELRTRELRGSCAALGIDEARCVALDRPELQDNPKVWWDTDLIQKIVREYVAKWEVDAIITFDSGGVSGHINHRAVSAAISEYVNSDASAPEAYMVVTTSLLRKYTVLGDLPLTALRFTWRIVAALVWPSPGGAAASNSGMKGAHSHDSSKGGGGALVANSWGRYLVTRAAFRQHGSQYSWDRHLYMVLSRYVWFNDLVRARKA